MADQSYHVAIIMDGNGRWAQEQKKNRTWGHEQGAKALRVIVEHCPALGIKHLTLYAFSAENWQRCQQEVTFLMILFTKYLEDEAQSLHKSKVRVRIIGGRDALDKSLQDVIERIEDLTKDNDGLHLQLAINYGARQEIVMASQKLATLVQQGFLDPQEITQEVFAKQLWTQGTPDPDIMIRTGGERRLSNYLLWQLSYSELFFFEKWWPDFGLCDLTEALKAFQARHRRYGALPSSL